MGYQTNLQRRTPMVHLPQNRRMVAWPDREQVPKKRSCLYFWASVSENVDDIPGERVEQRIPCLQNSKADHLSCRGNAPRLGLSCPCFEDALHDQYRLNFRGIQISQTNVDANVERKRILQVSPPWNTVGSLPLATRSQTNLKNIWIAQVSPTGKPN